MSVVDLFQDGWGHVAAVLVEPAVVVPVDPRRGGDLDGVEVAPGSLAADHFGLVEAVDALGQGVVIGGADRADRRRDARVGEPLA